MAYKTEKGFYTEYPHGFYRLTTPIVYLNDWTYIEDPFEEQICDENGVDVSKPAHYFWTKILREQTVTSKPITLYVHN